MAPSHDPIVQGRRLRAELRRLREGAGLTQQQVAKAMEWSPSKLIRIESDLVGISITDLRALLQHYGVDDQEKVRRYEEMARASKSQQGWWTSYRDVAAPQYATYLSYENAASSILVFQPLVIPGLLQEEEYARALMEANPLNDRIDRGVELRMRRQKEVFGRAEAPRMLFVLDEAVLHRQVGGPEVMRQQLLRLKRDAERENVTIEVVPFRAGAHAGTAGPFVILEFPDYADDLLYLETTRGSVANREDQEGIDAFRKILGQIRITAEGADFAVVLDNAMSQMTE